MDNTIKKSPSLAGSGHNSKLSTINNNSLLVNFKTVSSKDNNINFKQAALAIVKRGKPIFPCKSNGKTPLTKTGFKEATTDPGQIEEWWTKYPKANIGMPTGKISGISAVDLDIDLDKKKEGKKEWEIFCKNQNIEPYETLVIKTPRGGSHLYYKHDGSFKNSTDKIGYGIDTRGDGGYILIPPSIVNGKRYIVSGKNIIKEIPKAVSEIISPPNTIPVTSPNYKPSSKDEEQSIIEALKYINPDCDYTTWCNIGMALKDWNPAKGLQIFESWSSKGGKKFKPGLCKAKWNSFKGSGITIATLFKTATNNGYKSESFSSENNSLILKLPVTVKKEPGRKPLMVEEWGAIDLDEDYKKISPFPINSLPTIVREMTVEIQEVVKVQPEVAALAIITTLSACFGNKIYTDIAGEVKTRTNIYAITFLARGERKSAIYGKTIQPIYNWIDTKIDDYKRAKKGQSFKFRKLKALDEKLVKATGNAKELEFQIKTLEREIEGEDIITPFFLAENTTNEAAIDILKSTGGKVALFADDARDLIQVMMGLYSDGYSKEHLYTKIYDGFNPLTNNRKKDEVIIYYPCAVILLMTQVDVIELISKVESFFAGGFISRIDFCYPNSLVGKRHSDGSLVRPFDKRRMSPEVTAKYENLIFSLLDKYYYNQEEINIPVTPDAEKIWIDFYHEVEGNSHDDGLFGGIKLDYAIRIAQKALKYTLNFALIEGAKEIHPKHMKWGIDFALYYYQHAERVFDAISKKVLSKNSKKILSQIGKHLDNPFTSTNIMQFCNLKKDPAVKAAEELVAKNYIREITTNQIQGRKTPAQKYEVNPQFLKLQKEGKI